VKLDLWVSDAESPVRAVEATGLGADWMRVGEVDSRSEADLVMHVQRLLGARVGRDRRTLDPGVARGVGLAASSTEFWLALEIFGDRSRVAFSNQPARLAVLERQPPEPHPGLVKTPAIVPIRIKAPWDNGALTLVSA
jgi:hypothetical protein